MEVEKAVEPPKKKEERQVAAALPVVGVIAALAAVGAYLYKKKPWKKGDSAPAPTA
ncbi:hypothetical protein MNEG_15368 [Monoraphidium neglectum]|uniref:Uncharacterized protein n=1 Tax=Monoraphidium neglectum TaxID=145388 RepID=A0A0D2LRV0_9CHLO|nr:hypothetical protein MNEG_15368 [Monoraphidium neglectum]KIY92596.1 hypothetical protein MNEG_15368 [Monoraphidium neglectum]|eukprot:XP_013891616.1 hypothetical protein MNEG_15368 [Monoraphidium neglectum]